MLDSVHGLTQNLSLSGLYSAAFPEEEECKHLDAKHFIPMRRSQKSITSLEAMHEDAALGMGVWGSGERPIEDTANTKTSVEPSDLAESKSDNGVRTTGKSRSVSVEIEKSMMNNPSDNLHVSELFKCHREDEKGKSCPESDHKIDSYKHRNSSKAESSHQSRQSCRQSYYMAEHLPPTWDPQTAFCFPVKEMPVVRLVPDNLELSDFTDVQHIADGSNANVFLADLNEETVIIKMIREEVQTDPVAVHEFDVEHGMLVRVSHPHIIKILGAGRIPRRLIVLEYLGSGSLNSILQKNILKPGIMPKLFHKSTFNFKNLLSKARDLAEALHYLHSMVHKGASIIHRDLKPDNVGFTAKGELKLFDFGLCTCVLRRDHVCQGYEMTGNTGSLRYMAPEVVLRQIYSEKVDVYSFGILLWQMATDIIPFKGLSRNDFIRSVVKGGVRPPLHMTWPSAFSHLLQACWNTNPKYRPSFHDIIEKLIKMRKNQF
mmetsp:Transcript_2935/g.3073  ORF Transcript_2935/g.3073 Transcript_2935/m.3073 type:complete len:488 (+) Transcript_2935:183-1646(+)|eukprot:CAMPEP_0119042756 /NCGR_PEP_ID=MMETSP1177-20130426/16136_1 /TAXON_ID=2985 /ORGANISM="Ochromonas sp, Strain CCMP1899" /LENGTH=487 /DNA_ID=CAMNT_0007009757 /DNA_START=160 /DNA_END=1623 /DNA_ORIENTATION=-